MKTIIHVVNSKEFSGLESVACDIINHFDNYKMYYVTQDGTIVDTLKEKKINYFIINKMSKKEIKRAIKELKPDIIHAHDYRASVICALTGTKIPIISHIHNNSSWIKRICVNSIAFLYAGIISSRILIVSDAIKKEYIFSRFISKKFTNIGNPICTNKILKNVKKDDYKKKYDICCVARMTEAKNPISFFKIISKLKDYFPNLKVVWVGCGELMDECKNLINKLGICDNVELVGFQKNPYKYMASSKIFLLTSKWEGYGIAAYEALTLGLPCVVSNVGGLTSIVEDKCGFLCNKDEEFIISIKNILTDEKIYQKMSMNATERAKKLENLDEYYKKIADLYKEV